MSTHGLESISNEDFDTLMLSSIFCPVLPGDVPYRIKFTHAILAGCLPVVVDFPSYVRGLTSWWKPYAAPYVFNVPFPDKVNYPKFAVTVPWSDSDVFPETVLQTLLSIGPEEIQERQRAMEETRNFNIYDWSGTEPDAFTAVLDRFVDLMDGVAVF